jgi:hypothetical protein
MRRSRKSSWGERNGLLHKKRKVKDKYKNKDKKIVVIKLKI